MKRRRERKRRTAFFGLLLAAVLAFSWIPACAEDGAVSDRLNAAEEEYTEPEYSETDAFAGSSASAGVSAEQENNDGDDVYVSNNGTVFRIPRASDPSERVFDYAGLFTEEQQETLRNRIARLQEQKKCDVIILIPDEVPLDVNNGTETSQKYLRQFYIDNGFQEDGTGFIIDLDNRVLWTVGHGKYVTEDFVKFTNQVYNDCLTAAKRGDFYAAAETYLDDFDAYGNIWKAAVPTPLSLLLGAAASLLGMLGFNSKHKHTQPSRAATPPLEVRGYRSSGHRENYLGTTVSRRRIVHDDHSRGGGGGGFSGGFSSGGFSSGGGSFSGGGGKF